MNKRQKKKWKRWFIKDLYRWARRNRGKADEIIEKLKDQEYEHIKSESEEE